MGANKLSKKSKRIMMVLLVVSLVSYSYIYAQVRKPDSKKGELPKHIPGEVVVKFKTDSSGSSFEGKIFAMTRDLGSKTPVTVAPFESDQNYARVYTSEKIPMASLVKEISKMDNVQYAEPNWIYHTMGTMVEDGFSLRKRLRLSGSKSVSALGENWEHEPGDSLIPNDTQIFMDWGLINFGQTDKDGRVGVVGNDIGVTKVWPTSVGSRDHIIAIIDTGVDYTHEDLKNNIFVNAKEIPGNDIDDDANGFVDDVHGWNFNAKSTEPTSVRSDPMDDNGHGTHCAGTIGAEGNNRKGTAGVNWKTRILPLKFLSSSGSGSLADAVEAIKYATKMKANVMSNSWGGGGYSKTMHDAIKEAKDQGILFVAAAGNESNDNDVEPSYPASYEIDNVISVAASDNQDKVASWSNFGATKVHVTAPGVNIFSTVIPKKGNYAIYSGTSMATPHVAGAAMLLWSVNHTWNYKQIKDSLMKTVDFRHSLKKKSVAGGRLNVYNAVMNLIPPSDEPQEQDWKKVFMSIETPHPYIDSVPFNFEIKHPGAKKIRVHFKKIDTEAKYDAIEIRSSKGDLADKMSGALEEYSTDYVEGESLSISFKPDGSNDGYGFLIDRYDVIE